MAVTVTAFDGRVWRVGRRWLPNVIAPAGATPC
jgi:hypothetical protein